MIDFVQIVKPKNSLVILNIVHIQTFSSVCVAFVSFLI